MRGIDFGPERGWNQPVASEGNPRNARWIVLHGLLPAREVHRAGIGREHHKLGKRELGLFGHRGRGTEGLGTITGQTKDERAEHVYAVLAEGAKTLDQTFAGKVEILINVLQPLGRHSFHAHQCAQDVCRFHRRQKLGVFGGFHGDLSEENRVSRKLSQARHQFEALLPNRFQLLKPCSIVLPHSQLHVREGDGVKIVIGQSNKAKTEPPQLDDLFYNHIRRSLPGALPIGPPHGAEGAVLGTPSDGLDRGPHISIGWQQIPAGRFESSSFNPACFIDMLWLALPAIFQHAGPNDIAITFDHSVRASELVRFLRIESCVYAAKDYPRAAASRQLANFIAAQYIPGMNA